MLFLMPRVNALKAISTLVLQITKTTAPGKSGGLLQTARSTFRADIMRKWLLSEG